MNKAKSGAGGLSSNNPYSTRSSRRSIRILPRRRNSSRASPDWIVCELRVSLLVTKRAREREGEREELCVSVEKVAKAHKCIPALILWEIRWILSIAGVLGGWGVECLSLT